MKSPPDQAPDDEVIKETIKLIKALKETGLFTDGWIKEKFGTIDPDVGEKWTETI